MPLVFFYNIYLSYTSFRRNAITLIFVPPWSADLHAQPSVAAMDAARSSIQKFGFRPVTFATGDIPKFIAVEDDFPGAVRGWWSRSREFFTHSFDEQGAEHSQLLRKHLASERRFIDARTARNESARDDHMGPSETARA